MDAEYAYHCWEDDSILPEGQVHCYPKPAPCMFVELRMCNKLKKLANGDAGGDDAVIELVSKRIPFCFNHISFMKSEKMRPFVSVFLSLLCLPDSVKDSIIDEMFRFARSMLDDDENAGLEVLPFVVDVAVTILQMPRESEHDAIARAGNELQKLFPGRSNWK